MSDLSNFMLRPLLIRKNSHGCHCATDSLYYQQSLSKSRLRIMTCLEENMRASMTVIHVWMSRGHVPDIEYDIYELDQQTPGVKQSKQFYYNEGKISQP